jgi:Protein of unknown function (DUF2637)
MSDTLPVSTTQPGEAPRALRVLGLVAVCVGVAALAAATFVLSYAGIHAIALQAGISPRLARGYPLLIDAMLLVVLAALLSLRGAGIPSKILAWLTLLALLGAAAGADALHAAKDKLPARAAEITAAVLPWVLVFLAFVLLLAMLRHAHLRRLGTTEPAAASDIMPGFHDLPGQAGSAGPARSAEQVLSVPPQRRPDSTASAEVGVSAVHTGAARPDQDDQAVDGELAIDTQLPPDDPSSDEIALGSVPSELPQPEPVQPVQPEPAEPEPVLAEQVAPEPEIVAAGSGGPTAAEPPADTEPEPAGSNRIGNDGLDEVVVSGPDTDEAPPFGTMSPASTETAESQHPDMPTFHRISSSPIPPGGA